MGYTNYWTRKRAFTNDEWKKVKDEYEWLKEMGEGIIVDQSENKDEIMFNGMAIKGLDHETFCIDKKIMIQVSIFVKQQESHMI